MRQFEFEFIGEHRLSGDKRKFTIIAHSRIGALDSVRAKNIEYKFTY